MGSADKPRHEGETEIYIGAALAVVAFVIAYLIDSRLFVVVGAVLALWTVVVGWSRNRRWRHEDKEAAKTKDEELEPYREDVREFMADIDAEYSWMLERDKLGRQEYALREYEDVVNGWQHEKDRYKKLRRRPRVFDQVVADEAERGDRFLEIWELRKRLYHWAKAYSTLEQRHAKQLEIDREISAREDREEEMLTQRLADQKKK